MKLKLLNKKTNKRIIIILGILQLTIGLFSLGIAPLEIYSFYLFSEGGRFYYEGFGTGSFLYGLIFAQIAGFYFIALLFVPLGYGHLTLKKWTLKLSISCIWFWIVFGLPVALFFLPLLSMKEMDVNHPVLLSILFVFLFVILIPAVLLFFYKQKKIRKLFKNESHLGMRFQQLSVYGKILILTYILYIIVFHTMILYQGIFSFFGKFLVGFRGMIMLDICILFVLLFIYGLLKRIYWTWIFSLVFFATLIFSTIASLIRYPYIEIVKLLDFPELEKDIFIQLPLTSSYLNIGINIILLITLFLIVKAGKKLQT